MGSKIKYTQVISFAKSKEGVITISINFKTIRAFMGNNAIIA